MRAHALFRELHSKEIEALARSARLVRAARKEVIFKRGDPCEGFYVLAYGRVMLSLPAASVDKPLQMVDPGGSFGDITMFLERPFYLTAQALDDCLMVYVSRQSILDLIAHDGRFAMRMLASLSMRMRGVVDDIESFSLQPPAARLVTYLMRLLPSDGGAPAKIELTINKNMVAAQLNLTPETLSRYLRHLTDRGLITLKGRTVLVHDIDKLGAYMAAPTPASRRQDGPRPEAPAGAPKPRARGK